MAEKATLVATGFLRNETQSHLTVASLGTCPMEEINRWVYGLAL
jgi:hypothetical protein